MPVPYSFVSTDPDFSSTKASGLADGLVDIHFGQPSLSLTHNKLDFPFLYFPLLILLMKLLIKICLLKR